MTQRLCEAPFFAGDPRWPETMLTTSGCRSDAAWHVVRQNLKREPEGTQLSEAYACGTHVQRFAAYVAAAAKRGMAGAELPFRLEAITDAQEAA